MRNLVFRSPDDALVAAARVNPGWGATMHTPRDPGGSRLAPPAPPPPPPVTAAAPVVERIKGVLSLELGFDGVAPFTSSPITFGFHPDHTLAKNIGNLVFVLKNRGYRQFEGVTVSGQCVVLRRADWRVRPWVMPVLVSVVCCGRRTACAWSAPRRPMREPL